jgi:hypothetical protein
MGKVVKKLIKPAIRAGAAYATGGLSEVARAATSGGGRGGFADIINAGGNILGARQQTKAIKSAADTEAEAARYAAELQKQATDQSLALQERMFNQQNALQRQLYDEQVARQEPFRLSGLQSQNRLNELMGLGANTGSGLYGRYARDFSMQDFQADPGYAFRMSEGLKSLDRQAAVRGGLISGGALKAAQMYGQDLGSQEYQNAFNRYQTNRANQLNPLQSMMGAGQTSVNALGDAAQAYGSGMGSAAQNYASGGGSAFMTGGANMAGINRASGLNQAGLRLDRGNVSAGQYGNYGNLLGAIGGMFK